MSYTQQFNASIHTSRIPLHRTCTHCCMHTGGCCECSGIHNVSIVLSGYFHATWCTTGCNFSQGIIYCILQQPHSLITLQQEKVARDHCFGCTPLPPAFPSAVAGSGSPPPPTPLNLECTGLCSADTEQSHPCSAHSSATDLASSQARQPFQNFTFIWCPTLAPSPHSKTHTPISDTCMAHLHTDPHLTSVCTTGSAAIMDDGQDPIPSDVSDDELAMPNSVLLQQVGCCLVWALVCHCYVMSIESHQYMSGANSFANPWLACHACCSEFSCCRVTSVSQDTDQIRGACTQSKYGYCLHLECENYGANASPTAGYFFTQPGGFAIVSRVLYP